MRMEQPELFFFFKSDHMQSTGFIPDEKQVAARVEVKGIDPFQGVRDHLPSFGCAAVPAHHTAIRSCAEEVVRVSGAYHRMHSSAMAAVHSSAFNDR